MKDFFTKPVITGAQTVFALMVILLSLIFYPSQDNFLLDIMPTIVMIIGLWILGGFKQDY